MTAKTVRKWRDRFSAEGPPGLVDRSSRPREVEQRSSATLAGLRAWLLAEHGISFSTGANTACDLRARAIEIGIGAVHIFEHVASGEYSVFEPAS